MNYEAIDFSREPLDFQPQPADGTLTSFSSFI